MPLQWAPALSLTSPGPEDLGCPVSMMGGSVLLTLLSEYPHSSSSTQTRSVFLNFVIYWLCRVLVVAPSLCAICTGHTASLGTFTVSRGIWVGCMKSLDVAQGLQSLWQAGFIALRHVRS